jgi:hypothetical protein
MTMTPVPPNTSTASLPPPSTSPLCQDPSKPQWAAPPMKRAQEGYSTGRLRVTCDIFLYPNVLLQFYIYITIFNLKMSIYTFFLTYLAENATYHAAENADKFAYGTAWSHCLYLCLFHFCSYLTSLFASLVSHG